MCRVRDVPEARRFELEEAGAVAFADYRRVGGRLIIDHVEAPMSLRGTGAASRLMEGVALAARRNREKITPLCSYAAAWLARRADFSDLS